MTSFRPAPLRASCGMGGRLFKTVANPFSRTALIMFAWTHRRTIMRWGRSFWTRLTQRTCRSEADHADRQGLVGDHFRDPELAGARQLKHVHFDADRQSSRHAPMEGAETTSSTR
ncbi:MAG: hypothetical protein R2705_25240 [Ilumatobacteraceae bacterium]